MTLNDYNINFIKNIIKNQRNFNYDTIPDITLFADIEDKTNISPLSYYCLKKNKDKIMTILNTPNFSKKYKGIHPFVDICYYKLSEPAEIMLDINYLPKNDELSESFCLCLNKKMEHIAIKLLNKINPLNIVTITDGRKYINPLSYSIKNDLENVFETLINNFKILNKPYPKGQTPFSTACKYNRTKYIKYILSLDDVEPFSYDYYIQNSIEYLMKHKNEECIIEIINHLKINGNLPEYYQSQLYKILKDSNLHQAIAFIK